MSAVRTPAITRTSAILWCIASRTPKNSARLVPSVTSCWEGGLKIVTTLDVGSGIPDDGDRA